MAVVGDTLVVGRLRFAWLIKLTDLNPSCFCRFSLDGDYAVCFHLTVEARNYLCIGLLLVSMALQGCDQSGKTLAALEEEVAEVESRFDDLKRSKDEAYREVAELKALVRDFEYTQR